MAPPLYRRKKKCIYANSPPGSGNLRLLIPSTKATQLPISITTRSTTLGNTGDAHDILVRTGIMIRISAAIPRGGDDHHALIVRILIGLVVRLDVTPRTAEAHGDDLRALGDAVVYRVDDGASGAGAGVGQALADVEGEAGGVGVDAHHAHCWYRRRRGGSQ